MHKIFSFILFLFPIHLVFIKIKNFLYDNNIIDPIKIDTKIISIGNVSLGGAGKTPFTIALSNFLKEKMGVSVGVVTRGYGRRNSHHNFLFNNHSWQDCGDEVIVLTNNLSRSIPVYISSNKILGAKELSSLGCDIVILDDAFQHRKLGRDIDIVLLSPDELVPKNKKTFPWGLLREPFYNIKRANIIIATKMNLYNSKILPPNSFPLNTSFQKELLSSDDASKITIKQLSKLKIYKGSEHPHSSQNPKVIELNKLRDDFRDNQKLKVAIITGGGEKFFSAGWDLKAVNEGEAPDADYGVGGFGGLQELPNMNKPIIAAVNGIACGGGFEIMISADIIIAAEHSTFALPEINVGVVADAATIKLRRRIPYHVAVEFLMTGRWMDVKEAKHWGLVNEITNKNDLLKRAWEIAEKISKGPNLIYASIKEVLRETENEKEIPSFKILRSLETVKKVYNSDDLKEGASSFVKKTDPNWKDK